MFKRRQRKAPKVPVRDGLMQLLDQAALQLAAHGTVRSPTGQWIAAARVLLVTRHSCGWNEQDTPVSLLEPLLTHQGWTWAWEGADLVLARVTFLQADPNA